MRLFNKAALSDVVSIVTLTGSIVVSASGTCRTVNKNNTSIADSTSQAGTLHAELHNCATLEILLLPCSMPSSV